MVNSPLIRPYFLGGGGIGGVPLGSHDEMNCSDTKGQFLWVPSERGSASMHCTCEKATGDLILLLFRDVRHEI